MRPLLFILAFSTLISCASQAAEPFRFSLLNEVHSLDPAKFSGNEVSYFITSLFRGLYQFDDKKGLVPVGAKSCAPTEPLKMVCKLNPKVKWSNGDIVVAQDYVRAFQHFVNPDTKAKDAGLLLSLKNAVEVLANKAPLESLGVRAIDNETLEFTFKNEDVEFLYKLTSTLLVPLKVIPVKGDASTYIFNGPYKIKDWQIGSRVLLEPNNEYPFGSKKRPELEIYFIGESSTALDLFRLKKLDFITEISFSDTKAFKNDPAFLRTPNMRFDYIGFNTESINDINLREALSLSVDYNEFKVVFDSLGPTGCPGLPDEFMDRVPCLKFDLKRAKQALDKVDKSLLKNKLKLYFTKIASGNLQTIAEWYQAQWKKHLGLEIDLQAMEYSMYRQVLRTNPPQLFRVGVSLDRPTCLSAIESFASGNLDNFIRLKNPKYDHYVTELSKPQSKAQRKSLCRLAIDELLHNYLLIPQGKIHFARMLNPAYVGLKINSMGQIDFSDLHLK